MTWVKPFLDALKVVATSPYAFVAYVCLLGGFVYWLVSQNRLKAIARLPATEQAAVLEREYKVFPRSGLTGEEWIRSRRHTLTFWAFVVLIVAVVILSTISLLRVNSAATTSAGAGSTNNAGTASAAIPPTTEHGHTTQQVVLPPLDIPPIVNGGAPVGSKYQNRYLKNNVQCIGETVKVSATEWQERNSSGNPASCDIDAVIFKYTERESNDPQYFLLYDEGRNLFARIPNIPIGQTGPTDWRLVSSQTWNVGRSLTRVN